VNSGPKFRYRSSDMCCIAETLGSQWVKVDVEQGIKYQRARFPAVSNDVSCDQEDETVIAKADQIR
jgi:hypothetical protein